MDEKEKVNRCYRIDRHSENIDAFPEREDMDPPGNIGWLTKHYRLRGWNINNLRSDMYAEFGSIYGSYGPDGMIDLYTALLSKRKYREQLNVANDDEPDRRRDAARLWEALGDPADREGWFTTWRPPTYGSVKPSFFAMIASKLPRIHTRLYRANMIALHATGNPSPFV